MLYGSDYMKKIYIFIALLLVLCFISFYFFFNREKSFSMVMAGDTLVTYSILKDGYNDQNKSYNFSKMFRYIKDYIKDYDLAYYNQETPISGSDFPYWGSLCYNTPPHFAIDMFNVGFNMVSLANNHVLDGQYVYHDDKINCINNTLGVINSIKFWNKYPNIYVSGINESQDNRDKIVVKEKNGIKYAMLSYTYGTNMDDLVEYDSYLVNVYSDEQAKKDIEKVRDKVDVLFVSMHWGEENHFVPSNSQKKQAKYLASLGVDIIIGTHPHVIQPIEWIDDTLVIYSLGNLITAQTSDYDYGRLVGMMVTLDIQKKNKKIFINNVKCELTYNYYDEGRVNFLVIPFSYIVKYDSGNYLRLYEKYSKIVRMFDNDITINQIGTNNVKIETSEVE